MNKLSRNIAILIISGLFIGCYSERSYKGDGVLADNGPLSFYGRYDLHLGNVSLAESREYAFQAAKLPKERFAVGFNIQSLPNDAEYATVNVHLIIQNERREVVVDESGPLSEWVWGHASGGSESFVYRRGKSKDVQVTENTWKSTPIGVKADQGHGSYFMPRPNGKYEVRIKVQVSMPRQMEVADVMFSGVGA